MLSSSSSFVSPAGPPPPPKVSDVVAAKLQELQERKQKGQIDFYFLSIDPGFKNCGLVFGHCTGDNASLTLKIKPKHINTCDLFPDRAQSQNTITTAEILLNFKLALWKVYPFLRNLEEYSGTLALVEQQYFHVAGQHKAATYVSHRIATLGALIESVCRSRDFKALVTSTVTAREVKAGYKMSFKTKEALVATLVANHGVDRDAISQCTIHELDAMLNICYHVGKIFHRQKDGIRLVIDEDVKTQVAITAPSDT